MDDNKERRRLLGICRTLKPAEAMILQLLSVIYATVSAADLARTALRYNSGLQSIGTLLGNLVLLGLIEDTGDGVRCNPLLREPLTQAALKNGNFHSLVGVVRDALWRDSGWMGSEMRSYEQGVARLRAALYQGNQILYNELAEHCTRSFPTESAAEPPVAVVCANPADCAFLKTLPKSFLTNLLVELLNHALHFLRPADHFLSLLEETQAQSPQPLAAVTLSAQWIYRGRFSKALKHAKTLPEEYAGFFRAWIDFLSGRPNTALAWFDNASIGRKAAPITSALYLLALLHAGRVTDAGRYAARLPEADNICRPLVWLVEQHGSCKQLTPLAPVVSPSPLANLFTHLAWYWEGDAAAQSESAALEELFTAARTGGYAWLAVEAAAARAALESNQEVVWAAKLANALKNCKCSPLVDLFVPKPPWERPLSALSNLLNEQSLAKNENFSEARMIWQITYNDGANLCELFALEQRLNLNGQWGRGKRLTWQSLYQPEDFRPYMTAQDRNICTAITREVRDGNICYELDYERALPAIVGHPLVFLADNKPVRVEIVSGEPELLALKENAAATAEADNADPATIPPGVRLRLSPRVFEEEKISLTRETPTRFRVTRILPIHWQINKILGSEGLFFPAAAVDKVRTLIGDLSEFLTVQSEIGGVATEIAETPADPRLRAQLLPTGDGLQVEFFVRPFGDRGSYYRPGKGANLLLSDFAGTRCRVSRNLSREITALEETITACPALRQAEFVNNAWHLHDAIDCLEFLLQLQELGEQIVLEWPQGGRRRIEHTLTPKAMSVRVARRADWFELTGEIKINEQLTLSMQDLLRLSTEATGRFVKISEEQYLALTDTFRRQLDDLRAFGELRDDGLRLPPLASLALEELAEEAGDFSSDLEWKQLIAKLRAPADFSVPSGLQGELRDYQLNGFKWMANLAAWNFGACLADDMGLGKTVQTLSLLLHRAECGAALVIAPTSVCYNWQQEAGHFAPALRVCIFGAGDREAMIAGAGNGDVIVCSYALLQQTEEMLTGKEWATVVLDEAQAIKNAATKRSQAAMKLQAGFRLVTTGTPIENHLGELWNIFTFLNRGLLGSHKRFQERFAIPIEKEQNAEARDRLKKLLRPFILRRLKTQVLQELPPRTDIIKTVPMSEEEVAFYEALRRRAVERLSGSDMPREQRNFQILAEIMRLRRACCNPRLVEPGIEIASSKLAEFGRIVDDLRENGHRVLVFSQFVDHLTLVREYLNEKNIAYQYLDGSTPEKHRRKVVEDFQNGMGDLFLISLKAGGQGLNLTAADYVIHLDPWWNPAVEDQASDRAHRIGQTRPVTIYRLVMQHSIEEKIVELHRRKRDLADSLLRDSNLGGLVSADDLLNLIRGTL